MHTAMLCSCKGGNVAYAVARCITTGHAQLRWGAATCVAAREAATWLCNCKMGRDVAYMAVREVIWPI